MSSPESSVRRPSPLLAILLVGAALVWAIRFLQSDEVSIPAEGLPAAVRPISLALLSESEYNRRFEHLLHESTGHDSECRRRGMVQLELLSSKNPDLPPPGSIGVRSFLRLAAGASSYPAYYRLGSDTIFSVSEDAPTLRHEWVHALHDQYGDLASEYQARSTTDGLYALRGVAEGVAIVVSGAPVRNLGDGSTLDQAALAFAYRDAPRAVHDQVGDDALAAFALRPQTVHQLLFGRPVSLARIDLPAPEPGEVILCEDRLGVLAVATMLRKYGVSDAQSRAMQRAWRGDRMRVVSDSSGTVRVIWAVAFSDVALARSWATGPAFHLPLTAAGVSMPVLNVDAPEHPAVGG